MPFVQLFRSVPVPLNRLTGWIIFATLSGLHLFGADKSATDGSPANAAITSTNATVVKVGPGRFQIGEVRISQPERTVSFPATVNLRDGNIEYVVVAVTGKTHE